MIARVFVLLIRGYQRFISPLLGSNCRFRPTCSDYALEAIQTHGAAKGLVLAVGRILRCNPFGKTGYDPVPCKGCWTNPNRKLYPPNKSKKPR
ncbi:MAG: membrane protein insertion efficiency factor YidD [Candidatus Fournierella pullistercoris]|uniref:Putative membrane protein insertion efficiency factor n=1 Tax=Candidatus Allofournierella pullistercoris TaxID=2838597 RepID=A0A948T2B9_9FIRM|nr:membrane protein insertion efficiency factor YidD [Candidatus Fournierella pullistercoris]